MSMPSTDQVLLAPWLPIRARRTLSPLAMKPTAGPIHCADVLAVDHDRRGLLEDDPGVAGRGQRLQGFLVNVHSDGRLLGLDDGETATTVDLLLEGPDLHDQVDLDVRADLDDGRPSGSPF